MRVLARRNSVQRKSRPQSCRGTAATETAVVLPVFLTLVLGAADFGRVFGMSAELSNAAWAGAEFGATHRPTTLYLDNWTIGVQNAVNAELTDTVDFNISQVTVNATLGVDSLGNQQVQVTASYLFKTIVDWPFIPTRIQLKSKVVMRQYR